ncbi:MAG: glycosyltransferase [Candidatus Aminicenantaceae bacterium]
MIDEKILFLVHTGCGNTPLKKFEKELHIVADWDVDIGLGEPLKKLFFRVLRYDFGKNYAEFGVRKMNDEIIELVRAECPKYVMWPSMNYEILESTFQAIRDEGSLILGWFFDDECRFDEYSKWWIPYLDYVLTNDRESVRKYKELGAHAMHFLITSNPRIFRRLEVPKKYNVSFVGARIADRKIWVDELKVRGIPVEVFGKGWRSGYVSLDEMVKIYNESRVNFCFVKSYSTAYGIETRPQMKAKIFDICMSGGFLLCEYIPGIEEHYKIDKEVVCFKNVEEAAEKIRYFLGHEEEREAIAQAGWERAHRDHIQSKWLSRIFDKIEEDKELRSKYSINNPYQFEMPSDIRRLPSSYHLSWARILMREGYEKDRWQEELDLALFYNPDSRGVWWAEQIGRLPVFIRPFLIRIWTAVEGLRKKLYFRLRSISSLRKTKRMLFP